MNTKLMALALLTVVVLSGCRTAPMQFVENQAFATPAISNQTELTIDDYKKAIIRAGATRGWTFQEEAPGNLVGTLNVRSKHSAKVRVLFDTQAFSFKYLESYQLNYNPDAQTIHPNYNQWINNLRKDIQAEITRAKAT